ncbi:MAG: hypothetical protein JW703_03400 [Candidatus Diapherotrites archaeon]|nr:hypothetical protein [Candidatus Diapherotrites archaeon]
MDNNLEFSKKIAGSLQKICPVKFKKNVLKTGKIFIEEYSALFKELDEIYENREKHSLKWAFKNAHEKFSECFSCLLSKKKVIEEKAKKINLSKEQEKLFEEGFELVSEKVSESIDVEKRNTKLFLTASSFVSSVDMVVSVFLILVISRISHVSESIIKSSIIGLAVIAFVALLKVILDRFYIIPKVDEFGWKIYKKEINKFKKSLSLLTALYVVEEQLIENKSTSKELLKVIENARKEYEE